MGGEDLQRRNDLMEREFSAPLHSKMNPEVAKLVEQGYNVRKAYRMVAHAKA